MKFMLTVALLALAMAVAAAQDFPPSIGVCGEGSCKDTPLIKDANGVPTGLGPVDATVPLGTPGAYPNMISLCGRGTCITIPVVTTPPPPPPSPSDNCPTSIGLCGFGICKVTPVIFDANDMPTGVGPVDGSTGAAGEYPTDVGVCCRGVCTALPVVTASGGRKMLL